MKLLGEGLSPQQTVKYTIIAPTPSSCTSFLNTHKQITFYICVHIL